MIKQFIPKEICLKCQGCCRFREEDSVWLPCLLDEEIQVLLGKDIPQASISASRKIQPVPAANNDGFVCAFFNPQSNFCKIYAYRPFECQLYPFLINLRGKKIILTLDLNCPYVRERLNTKELDDYTGYLVEFLNAPSQLRMLKDNPQILQAYEEVCDTIELEIIDETE